MNYYLSLAALVPAVILFVRIYQLDRIEKEPRRLLGVLILSGALLALPAAVVAVSEEVCKIVPVHLAAWKHPAFDYRFDAVVYSVSSALGFAAVENIIYVVQSDLRTAVSRAVLSVPGHFFFAVAMGLLLSRAKQAEKRGDGRRRTILCALAILAPVVLHGVWDFLLAVRRPWATAAFYCFVLAFFITANCGLRRASQTDAHL